MLKLIIESGPAKGKTAEIPPEGLSIGRASQNDFSVPDPQLSRHHCKVYFADGKLFVTDLASANGTLVNDTPVEGGIARLSNGDKIAIGDTVILVSDPSAPAVVSPPRLPTFGTAPAPQTASSKIDLGFSADPSHSSDSAKQFLNKKALIRLAAVFSVLAAVIVAIKVFVFSDSAPPASNAVVDPVKPDTLEIRYAKIEGSEINIFKYELTLDADGILSVTIDDLAQGRNVRRTSENPLDPDTIRALVRKFERARFFDLDTTHEGIPRANTWNTRRLTAVINNEAKTIVVRNRIAPEALRSLFEDIEEFARAPLELFAMEFPREKLIELAEESLFVGTKLFNERDIRPGNLYESIRKFKSSISYLETIEPKPAFYDRAVDALTTARAELDAVWTERNFRAEHASRTRDWNTAARTLRELLEIIPDRTDERNRAAERALITADAELKKLRK